MFNKLAVTLRMPVGGANFVYLPVLPFVPASRAGTCISDHMDSTIVLEQPNRESVVLACGPTLIRFPFRTRACTCNYTIRHTPPHSYCVTTKNARHFSPATDPLPGNACETNDTTRLQKASEFVGPRRRRSCQNVSPQVCFALLLATMPSRPLVESFKQADAASEQRCDFEAVLRPRASVQQARTQRKRSASNLACDVLFRVPAARS